MFRQSALNSSTYIGKILRFPLKLIPKNAVIPVLFGPNRGFHWIVGSGVNGYWLGIYENEKQVFFSHILKKNAVVYDVGANVGYYSIMASRLVGPAGKVFAFEPVESNLAFLNRHIQINRINNISVIDYALSDSSGVASFDEGPNRSMGHIERDGNITIKTITLDDFIFNFQNPVPDVIKLDIEGSELAALLGSQRAIKEFHPTILLATHERYRKGIHAECCAFLAANGYALAPIDKRRSITDYDELIAIYKNRQD